MLSLKAQSQQHENIEFSFHARYCTKPFFQYSPCTIAWFKLAMPPTRGTDRL